MSDLDGESVAMRKAFVAVAEDRPGPVWRQSFEHFEPDSYTHRYGAVDARR